MFRLCRSCRVGLTCWWSRLCFICCWYYNNIWCPNRAISTILILQIEEFVFPFVPSYWQDEQIGIKQEINIRITKRFWLSGDDDYLRGATSINHQVALRANFKMYSRSAKGEEKGDPNRNPRLAKMRKGIHLYIARWFMTYCAYYSGDNYNESTVSQTIL